MLFATLPSLAGAEEAPAAPGAVLFQSLCASCHGAAGHGNDGLQVPAIAARPAWYVLGQLKNFREGRRGADPAEPQAMVMAAIVKNLAPSHLEALAACIEGLAPLQYQASSPAKADLAAGKELFEVRCMECHRFNASGELTFGSPPLTGLQGWYLLAQIDKFRAGRRGTSAGDVNGAKMMLAARFIESEGDRHTVVAYLLSLNRPAKRPGAEPFGSPDQ